MFPDDPGTWEGSIQSRADLKSGVPPPPPPQKTFQFCCNHEYAVSFPTKVKFQSCEL